jgi:hypothetical protein
MRLAAALKGARAGAGDAAAADCLQQAAPGPDQLKSPEPNFYVIGSKSYGRDPSFLLRTGHQQVEAVTSLLKQALLKAEDATVTDGEGPQHAAAQGVA